MRVFSNSGFSHGASTAVGCLKRTVLGQGRRDIAAWKPRGLLIEPRCSKRWALKGFLPSVTQRDRLRFYRRNLQSEVHLLVAVCRRHGHGGD